MPEARMTIGQFAQRSRLSPKALRLYDASGLLRPAEVDPRTGFRYYHPEQLVVARRVRVLRGVGLSLADIREILRAQREAPGVAADILRAYWRRAEATHAARRPLVNYLIDLFSPPTGGTKPMFEIATRDVAEQKVLTIQRRITVVDLPDFIGESLGRLYKHAEEVGGAAGAPLVIFHGEVNEESDGPVEACLPVTGTVEPAGEMSVRIEPAHREAYARLTKSQVVYPAILRAYEDVHDWLTAEGHKPSGSPREVYFTDFMAAAAEDQVCDVAFPY